MSKNNNGNGNGVGLPAAQPELLRPPDLPLHAYLDGDLSHSLWKDVPALSWLMNLEDGQLQVRGTLAESAVATAPVAVLGRLLRTVVRDEGSGPLQLLEVLPTLDGDLHHFLIIGFPVSGMNGAPHPYLAGVAIDVTRHKVRVDKLAHQALVDELTCVYNLRGFLLFAEHELKVARRRKTHSAIVYVDVDGLKTVNDVRGHGEGDALLVETATLLRRVFRECDVIGRLGGDEFAVFATDVKGDPAHLGERLRAEVPVAGIVSGHSTGLALSIGVAHCAPDANMQLAELIEAADRAMYQNKAKKAGRVSLEAAAAALRADRQDTST